MSNDEVVPMNPEIKARWITALRSGDYQEGIGALTRVEGDQRTYCCLGVLCDLAVKANVIPEGTLRPEAKDLLVVSYGKSNETELLPPEVAGWAGIGASNPYIEDRSLAEYNDSGFPFTEIADMIEEHL